MLSVPTHRLMSAEEIAEEEKPFTACDLFSISAVATLTQAGFIEPPLQI